MKPLNSSKKPSDRGLSIFCVVRSEIPLVFPHFDPVQFAGYSLSITIHLLWNKMRGYSTGCAGRMRVARSIGPVSVVCCAGQVPFFGTSTSADGIVAITESP